MGHLEQFLFVVFSRFFRKEKDFTMTFWKGHSQVYGNLTALIDLADILEVALGKSIDEAKSTRPKNWPVGYP